MALDSTLTDVTARLPQGRFAFACHPEHVEGSLSFTTKTPRTQRTTSQMPETLPRGWLVATNLNNILKRTIIKLAAKVSRLTFGEDVVVEF